MKSAGIVPPAASSTPWLAILVRPRRTIRAILDTNPKLHVHKLAILAGFDLGLSAASETFRVDRSLLTILALSLTAGAFKGIVALYIFGWALVLTGSWFGGRGTSVELRTAVAWSAGVLGASMLVLWLPMLVIFGRKLFMTGSGESSDPVFAAAQSVFATIAILVGVWQFIIALVSVSEAHQFSKWRALGSIVVGAVLVGVLYAFVDYGILPWLLLAAYSIGLPIPAWLAFVWSVFW